MGGFHDLGQGQPHKSTPGMWPRCAGTARRVMATTPAPTSQGRSKQVVDYSRRRFRYRASSNWFKSTDGGSAGIGLNRRCPETGRFVYDNRGVEVAPFRSQPVVATLACRRPTAIAAVRDSTPGAAHELGWLERRDIAKPRHKQPTVVRGWLGYVRQLSLLRALSS